MKKLNIARALRLLGIVSLFVVALFAAIVSIMGAPEPSMAAVPDTEVPTQSAVEAVPTLWAVDAQLPGRPFIDAHFPRYNACRTWDIGGVDPTDGVQCDLQAFATITAEAGVTPLPTDDPVIVIETTPPATSIVTTPPPSQTPEVPTETPEPSTETPAPPDDPDPTPTECKNKNAGKDGTPYECNAGIGQEKNQ